MGYDIAGLLDLWSTPPAPGADPAAPFRDRYADPVRINGTDVAVADLAARAEVLRSTFDPLERRVLAVSETSDQGVQQVTVVFEMGGPQTGPFPTSAGELAASGRELRLRVIDLLIVRDGLITELWMAADELGALAAHDLVALAT
jgi:ketosteroid isomerase-like protein